MIWILYAILSTGEAGPVPLDQTICAKVASAIQQGASIAVDREDGSQAEIVGAACLGPAEADPCEMEGTS
jgi:hypothetical protein